MKKIRNTLKSIFLIVVLALIVPTQLKAQDRKTQALDQNISIIAEEECSSANLI